MTTEARQLEKRYGVWGEHPDFPSADWREEISNTDTRLGYWDWVASQIARIDRCEECGGKLLVPQIGGSFCPRCEAEGVNDED